MRDAFGGVFMTNLFLVFIVIYVAFTAVSLNYAKAFRLKNQVIDFLETNEITSLEKLKDKHLDKLHVAIVETNYYKECSKEEIKNAAGKITTYCIDGVTISKAGETKISGTDAKIIKYKVSTYADWNLGILNKILALGGQREDSKERQMGLWQISGEAEVVSK